MPHGGWLPYAPTVPVGRPDIPRVNGEHADDDADA
jgi:hypothetical protein